MEIVECINSVKVGSQIIFRKGELIDVDNLSRIPFDCSVFDINFNNPEYFRKYKQEYNIGAFVLYSNTKGTYFCRIAEFIPSSKKYRIKEVNGGFSEIVSERDIVLVNGYYFINTEGVICATYIGKNKMRDKWLFLTGNQFKTEEEAKNKYNEITNGKY
jgi:hypothetical protein